MPTNMAAVTSHENAQRRAIRRYLNYYNSRIYRSFSHLFILSIIIIYLFFFNVRKRNLMQLVLSSAVIHVTFVLQYSLYRLLLFAMFYGVSVHI